MDNLKIYLPDQKRPVEIISSLKSDYYYHQILKPILKNLQIKNHPIAKIIHPKIKTPIHIRMNTSDVPTFSQIFIHKEYDFPINFQPKLIIDAGANVGYAAIWFANQFPNSQIIAVEPEKSNFDLLKINTSKYKNIKLVNAAIWSKQTNLKLVKSHFPWSGHWDFQIKETKHQNQNSLKAVTIGDILKQTSRQTIDILKIDIEGSEKEIFSNHNSQSWLEKTKMIIIELHDRYQPGCSKIFYNAVKPFHFKKSTNGENIILTKNSHSVKNNEKNRPGNCCHPLQLPPSQSNSSILLKLDRLKHPVDFSRL